MKQIRVDQSSGASVARPVAALGVSLAFIGILFLASLFLVQPASAAVGISSSGGCTQTATNTNVCTITVAVTAGHTLIVGIGSPGTRTVSSVTGGGTTTKLNQAQNTVDSEVWGTTVGGASTASSITVTMSGNGRFVAFATDYTGVLFYGPSPAPTNTGSTANPTLSYVLDDANDWLVTSLVNTGTAPTAGTGNLRDARAATGVSQGWVDNTAASATGVTTSITHGATTWAAAGLELVIASGCTRTPTFTYSSGSAVTFHPVAPWGDAHATAADGQGAGTPAVTVTNKGPGTCNIGIKRATAAPTGVEDQWNTANSAPSSGTNDITTSNQQVCASVAQGATCSVYLWSRVTASTSTPPNTYTNTYTFSET